MMLGGESNNTSSASLHVATSGVEKVLLAYSVSCAILGLVGNLVTIAAAHSRGWKISSCRATTQYLVAICVTDTVVLLNIGAVLLRLLPSIPSVDGGLAQLLCKVETFLGYASIWNVPFLILQLTFIRFHAVKYPVTHRYVITTFRARIGIATTVIISVLYNSWYLVASDFGRIEGLKIILRPRCHLAEEYGWLQTAYDYQGLVLLFSVPVLLLSIMNIWLAWFLLQRIRKLKLSQSIVQMSRKISSSAAMVYRIRRSAHCGEEDEVIAAAAAVAASNSRKQLASLMQNPIRAPGKKRKKTSGSSKGPERAMSGGGGLRANTNTSNSTLARRMPAQAMKELFAASTMYLAFNIPMYVLRVANHAGMEGTYMPARLIYVLFTTQFSIHWLLYSKIRRHRAATSSSHSAVFFRSTLNHSGQNNDDFTADGNTLTGVPILWHSTA